jgi:hypothetical protein
MTTEVKPTFNDGFALGGWLHSTARPALRKWARSADERVRVQAIVLSGVIEGHAANEDWLALDAIRRAWVEAYALTPAPEPPDGQDQLPLENGGKANG